MIGPVGGHLCSVAGDAGHLGFQVLADVHYDVDVFQGNTLGLLLWPGKWEVYAGATQFLRPFPSKTNGPGAVEEPLRLVRLQAVA